MKQKHERKVTRFLITMAVALLVGGICGYLGAMYASSFSGVLAGLGTVLGYARLCWRRLPSASAA